MQQRDRADDRDRGHDHALDDGLVVALADERPQPLVQAERRQHDDRHDHDPRDGRCEQVLVPARHRALEPQPEGEEVSERDQETVHQQLRDRMAVDGKGRGSDPLAHAAAILVRLR